MRNRIETAVKDVAAAQAVVDALRPVAAQHPGTFAAAQLARAEALLGEYRDDLADAMERAIDVLGYRPAGAAR